MNVVILSIYEILVVAAIIGAFYMGYIPLTLWSALIAFVVYYSAMMLYGVMSGIVDGIARLREDSRGRYL